MSINIYLYYVLCCVACVVLCCVVLCGVVWCGVVWCGVVWCGLLWSVVVCCGVMLCDVGVGWIILCWGGMRCVCVVFNMLHHLT